MEKKKRINVTDKNIEYQDTFNIDYFNSRWMELMEENGMNQKQLADYLEVHPNQLVRWKNKDIKTAPQYKHIRKLSKLFNVDEEFLYNPEYTHRNYGEEYQMHIQNIENTFRSGNKTIIDFIESLGYDVESNGNGSLFIFNEDGEPVHILDDALIKRLKLIVEYTLLS